MKFLSFATPPQLSLNWTKVELKYAYVHDPVDKYVSLNWTKVELK